MTFLLHTKVAFSKIWDDFKKIYFYFKIATHAFALIFLLYSLITNLNLWIVHTLLLMLEIAYAIFSFWDGDWKTKEIKKEIKKSYKAIKLVLKAIPLGISLYGLFLAAENLTVLSLLLPVLTLVSWILTILMAIVGFVLERYLNLVFDGLSEDFKRIPFLGKWINDITDRDVNTNNLEQLRELATAVDKEIQEKRQTEKQTNRERKKDKIKKFFHSFTKKSE